MMLNMSDRSLSARLIEVSPLLGLNFFRIHQCHRLPNQNMTIASRKTNQDLQVGSISSRLRESGFIFLPTISQSEALPRSGQWHHHGISALVTQTSFCEGSSGDLAKRRLSSQATINCIQKPKAKCKTSIQNLKAATDNAVISWIRN